MKVLHVIPSLSPDLGGPTQVVLKTVKAIRQQGIDAEIVTTNHHLNQAWDVPLYQLTDYEDVPVWFLPGFPYSLKEYIFSSALSKWLWQHMDNYDILDNHYLFSYAPTCAAAIARWKRIPYTVRTQGQLTPWALKQSPFKKQLYTFLIERQNLNRAAAIHCTTVQETENLRKFGINTPTITLPLGVEQPTQILNAKSRLHHVYSIPRDRLIILFLSRLHPKKRPDLLIDAFKQVVGQNSNCHLMMAGFGATDYLNYLRQQVANNNLTNYVTFTGFVTGSHKQLILQGTDIFVLPSYSENFGIAVAEAMVSGLPVIVTPGVQIATDIAAANAGIIINDRATLVTAITQLLESTEMRSHLGQNAAKLASDRYNWNKIATRLVDAYAEIIYKP